MISQRLLTIANYVGENDITADIGCDHALLSIYLIKHKDITKAYACDVNKGPLESGLKNAIENGVSEKITFINTDGFKKVPNDFTTGIVAGMGGHLISTIIEQSIDSLKGKKVILQPNNGEQVLRHKLKELGFEIVDEQIIDDNDIAYEIIYAIQNNKTNIVTHEDELIGPILKNKPTKILINKVEQKISSTKSFINNIKDDKLEVTKNNLKTWEDILCR